VTVHLYDHFPLNGGKNMLHAEPKVKVGDRVERHQLLADTNYTKDGELAIGTNMRVAYLPYHGLNFEDGIVVSESAATKMTSLHLHAESAFVFPGSIVDPKRWQNYALPELASPSRMAKIGSDGVIKEGSPVEPGDVLVTLLTPMEAQSPEARDLMSIKKSLVRDFQDRSLKWDHDYPGVVAKVERSGSKITVYVKTEEPLHVGDKLSGRHGNKGIVSRVIPDHEMPKDKDGNPSNALTKEAALATKNIVEGFTTPTEFKGTYVLRIVIGNFHTTL
jgi:DNA-directed RNA polymerase subunit beta